ncbi:ATP-binding protein [Nocardiopsis sp. EMB25]|uniref:ATP-binding protein n=1 Tax=Nocardiopsis sp. EMB25 TaxID=2835867 RepID=UPI002284905A|nr:ATP-binding protein [Nocardiopsis sp. EMB25]MCY9786100.1 ATP-binding protein [Nocardiopsis sp. EMB25]
MSGFEVPRPRCGHSQDRRVVGGLPVRVKSRRAGVAAAYFDGAPAQVGRIRTWCAGATGLDEEANALVKLVVSELVTNTVIHTASGGRCGRVRVTVEVLPGRVVLVSVTDDGPRALRPVTVPVLTDRIDGTQPSGRGLRLVAALAEKWWWTGCPGGPLTVWALIDTDRDLDT